MNSALTHNYTTAALQALAEILDDSQATIAHRLRAACTILRFSMRPRPNHQADSEIDSTPPNIPIDTPRPAAPKFHPAAASTATLTPAATDPTPHLPAAAPALPILTTAISSARQLLTRAGAPPSHFTQALHAPFLTLHPP